MRLNSRRRVNSGVGLPSLPYEARINFTAANLASSVRSVESSHCRMARSECSRHTNNDRRAADGSGYRTESLVALLIDWIFPRMDLVVIHDSALAALGSKARSGVRQVATVGSYHGVGVAKGFGIREDRDSG